MNKMREFYEIVEENPVIAAVKDEEGVETCCTMEEVKVIFVLYGDICSIPGIVKRIKEAGKTALVHIDLITGLSAKEAAVDYIKNSTSADGILSTKPLMIQRAKELSMYAVLRYFVIDSMAIKSIENLDRQRGKKPDFIEVMPGVMPKVIRKICRSSRIPVIAGGLIADKEDVMGALEAGAVAVSSTNRSVWEL
ncbi:glycerol-3-phosphate responsive antiterminator [Muricomes sp. OA1]|uniref:Glycerol-3-phosphate responsive antiterminator n=1 Tax=Hungatella hathewayi TaxID=154046 RepID=A0A3E2WZI7_9FIRM|nr:MULTISPECIES: glycerol-3-phosphate responsive antiterminator [Clostridia]MBS6762686.1 glycerol-3-phosphate responsive antiterminator [Clostridium sp.]MEE0202267.1 glycerol-3-phosphate responsive antiterminator [Muricomes sp.]MCH1972990.1 glycerol-3-phosphate responsive antiterminator [Muricomes sp. OA1]MRM90506.1 glycerol-3-phosphate responsive antiterminator [Faecalicatena contorta]RGC33341.1 glycerol-3-phosphate responsive antiterminator [Hungatella hathewayi]